MIKLRSSVAPPAGASGPILLNTRWTRAALLAGGDTEARGPFAAARRSLVACPMPFGRDSKKPVTCTSYLEVDELMEPERDSSQMVERAISTEPGTGGSSSAECPKRTLFNAAFPDLWAIRAQP